MKEKRQAAEILLRALITGIRRLFFSSFVALCNQLCHATEDRHLGRSKPRKGCSGASSWRTLLLLVILSWTARHVGHDSSTRPHTLRSSHTKLLICGP